MKNLIKLLSTKILVLLGFSVGLTSCMMMYGVPPAEFQFQAKGTVKTDNGKPIEDIQVIVKDNFSPHRSDTTYTDENGNFTTAKLHLYGISDIESIEFNDIDSTANGGEFESQEIQVEDIEMETIEEGTGGWLDGGYEATVDVELRKKTNN